ncbi:NADP-dependent oxidoreductase [Pseudonocardia sp. N23]|uniref:quinone oxidoreductase family protein n=1 Tax=Pseudonocardia sp. N23 TaxID=1987376 RepID=UPI000BFCE757|nr:NADP-dependent oxidoreductase [Pseudonocardia sp. N23]GAY09087.1 putative oxidoreductase [Pseudonocardia sp. N23]
MTIAIVATAFGGPEVLSATEIEVPVPGPGEVTVRVRATSVNPIDQKRFSGLMGADPAALPMRLGNEAAGVVTAVGPDAQGPAGPVAVGDEVVVYPAPGSYAGEITVAATGVVPKPPQVSWEVAGSVMAVGATAVHTLEAARVGEGDTVVVHGASGGVGSLVTQLALARGATVIATASKRHHDTLRGYGAVPIVYGDGLADRIRAAAPSGVDAAIDTVGTDEAVDTSLELVADRGRVVSIVAFGRASEGFRLLGGGPGADPGTEIRSNAWRTLLPAVSEGSLRVVVAATFPLTGAADAITFVGTGHAGGKVVLVP